ncbi:hypothetical protein LCGC14_1326440 [marine sediment metagenome]|uniref:Uncharacterized protein n=1 Tax=marine sediment metagenome TaxID=412755 RepID=A0A0F9KI50_9ZZZZ
MRLLGSRPKSIEEIEEQSEYVDKEISLKQKMLMKKELDARGASLDAFKSGGKTSWDRVKNWLKAH